ncbi:hypothetical protein CS542_05065 [Pedobacter sp. IW39]|nr:hypothetical protein CS542_05065 [Pedobacter sp. IW39]
MWSAEPVMQQLKANLWPLKVDYWIIELKPKITLCCCFRAPKHKHLSILPAGRKWADELLSEIIER